MDESTSGVAVVGQDLQREVDEGSSSDELGAGRSYEETRR